MKFFIRHHHYKIIRLVSVALEKSKNNVKTKLTRFVNFYLILNSKMRSLCNLSGGTDTWLWDIKDFLRYCRGKRQIIKRAKQLNKFHRQRINRKRFLPEFIAPTNAYLIQRACYSVTENRLFALLKNDKADREKFSIFPVQIPELFTTANPSSFPTPTPLKKKKKKNELSRGMIRKHS